MGKFEYAGEGTLFLDEICSLPIHLQAKLLRVLEDRTITRLGSNVSIPVHARIIAATNRNLEEEIRKGTFREDLYFRLNVLPIEVPPLRERKSDIPVLVEGFRVEYCRNRKEGVKPFDSVTMDKIFRSDWPGNVRELKNYVRRLCIYDQQTHSADIQEDKNDVTKLELPENLKLKDFLETVEKNYIIQVLTKHRGQVVQTHQSLGISRKCLYDKIHKYGLNMDSFRNSSKRARET